MHCVQLPLLTFQSLVYCLSSVSMTTTLSISCLCLRCSPICPASSSSCLSASLPSWKVCLSCFLLHVPVSPNSAVKPPFGTSGTVLCTLELHHLFAARVSNLMQWLKVGTPEAFKYDVCDFRQGNNLFGTLRYVPAEVIVIWRLTGIMYGKCWALCLTERECSVNISYYLSFNPHHWIWPQQCLPSLTAFCTYSFYHMRYLFSSLFSGVSLDKAGLREWSI